VIYFGFFINNCAPFCSDFWSLIFVSAWSRCISLFAKRLKEIVKPTKTDAVVNNFFILASNKNKLYISTSFHCDLFWLLYLNAMVYFYWKNQRSA
jgi:hypothetical protein